MEQKLIDANQVYDYLDRVIESLEGCSNRLGGDPMLSIAITTLQGAKVAIKAIPEISPYDVC